MVTTTDHLVFMAFGEADNGHMPAPVPMPRIEINLDQAVFVLSESLDFVGVDDMQHGKRVTCLCLETATALGIGTAAARDLYHAALLHDIGVSSTRIHRQLINEIEWSHAEAHCHTGAELIGRFPPLAHLQDVILHHHSHWTELARSDLGAQERQLANLIFLCDRVDAVRAQRMQAGDPEPAAAIRATIAQFGGTLFDPRLVDAFLAISGTAGFWSLLEPERLGRYFSETRPPHPEMVIGLGEARDLAQLFAHVVDAKSPYTARHSEGVARLTCRLARKLGLAGERLMLIEIAALLHDLGKLRVPDEILDKRGALSRDEWHVMQRHSDDSEHILARIEGFASIARWAGLHHETLAGDGYPCGLADGRIPIEARIISVADVFQALAQDRPYRAGLAPDAVLAILREEVARQHLDGGIVQRVAADLEGCWQAAVGHFAPPPVTP
jgi:HD-GYP domain-containing protein (c-di-GMP phosphodiesterase class II)